MLWQQGVQHSFDNCMGFYWYNGTIWMSNKSRYNNSSVWDDSMVNSRDSMMNSRNTIGYNLGISFSLSIECGVRMISSITISKVAITMMSSVGQILGISLSLSLSIECGVRMISNSSISKMAITKMMSGIGKILGISFSLSLSIECGVRMISDSSISKVAVTKMMSVGQILGISLWLSKTN